MLTFKTSLVGARSGRGEEYEDALERQQRRYEKGKEQIVARLLDYSDLFGRFDAGETIEIEARLRDAGYFRRISRTRPSESAFFSTMKHSFRCTNVPQKCLLTQTLTLSHSG